MKPDDFEQRLQRLSLRPIPTEWREKILSRASEAPHAPRTTHHSFLSTINDELSTLLWPCPRAWAGLAAVWLVILALNLATGERETAVATRQPPPSPEMLMALREQQRLLAELIGPQETPVADKPKSVVPQPRSERREDFMVV